MIVEAYCSVNKSKRTCKKNQKQIWLVKKEQDLEKCTFMPKINKFKGKNVPSANKIKFKLSV